MTTLPTTPAEIAVYLDWLEETAQGYEPFDRQAARVRVLRASGTLERLGECMCLAAGTAWSDLFGRERRSAELSKMLEMNGAGSLNLYRNHGNCTRLCEMFNVPPVFVEVGTPRYAFDTYYLETTAFGPPSPALAAAVLEGAAYEMLWEKPDLTTDHKAFAQGVAAAVRQHHPNATAFRLRLADGPWHTRQL